MKLAAFDEIAKRTHETLEGNGEQSGWETEDWFGAEDELLHKVRPERTQSKLRRWSITLPP